MYTKYMYINFKHKLKVQFDQLYLTQQGNLSCHRYCKQWALFWKCHKIVYFNSRQLTFHVELAAWQTLTSNLSPDFARLTSFSWTFTSQPEQPTFSVFTSVIVRFSHCFHIFTMLATTNFKFFCAKKKFGDISTKKSNSCLEKFVWIVSEFPSDFFWLFR